MPGVITRPEVVCVFSVVVALVTVGGQRDADRGRCDRAAQATRGAGGRFLDAKTCRCDDPVVGVNFSPASPWARVMKLPLVIGVVPLF